DLTDALNRLISAFADDIGSAKILCKLEPRGMPAHDYDLLSSKHVRGYHSAESDRSIADHRNLVPFFNGRHDGRVKSGAHDIRQSQKRTRQSFILRRVNRVKRSVRLRNAQRFRLSTGDLRISKEPSVDARGVEAFLTKLASPVRERERHYDVIATLYVSNV